MTVSPRSALKAVGGAHAHPRAGSEHAAAEPLGERTSVVVAMGMRLHREAIAGLLRAHPRLSVVCDVASLGELHDATVDLDGGVALVELAMLQARDDVASLRRSRPDLRIVAMAAIDDATLAIACAEIGLAGWVARDATAGDLVDVIEAAARGELRCTPRTAAALARRVQALSAARQAQPPDPGLTVRERQILALIEGGLSNKEIAARLVIALPTVKNHVHHILDKLGARGRAEAVAIARGRLSRPPA